jgi:hypothetical protein
MGGEILRFAQRRCTPCSECPDGLPRPYLASELEGVFQTPSKVVYRPMFGVYLTMYTNLLTDSIDSSIPSQSVTEARGVARTVFLWTGCIPGDRLLGSNNRCDLSWLSTIWGGRGWDWSDFLDMEGGPEHTEGAGPGKARCRIFERTERPCCHEW